MKHIDLDSGDREYSGQDDISFEAHSLTIICRIFFTVRAQSAQGGECVEPDERRNHAQAVSRRVAGGVRIEHGSVSAGYV